MPLQTPTSRKRLRDLGVSLGVFPPGPFNSITDVAGVLVGHSTVNFGSGPLVPKKGPARTGVTAILPNQGDAYVERVIGGAFVLNGAGEVSGLIQVQEWGTIETPILLTNTLSVGTCSEATVRYMTRKYPQIGTTQDVVIPLVGECDDSWLNDIAGHHVRSEHVYEAIRTAKSGVVAEGNVGGGTGMITCDFKGGIGSSSRLVQLPSGKPYTLGVLVMSNFGLMHELRVDGIPVGEILAPKFKHLDKRRTNYGSIIAVLATDAPVAPHQLNRLAKRVALGIGRMGSRAAHGSGEIILAFSTGNKIPRFSTSNTYTVAALFDHEIDPFYQAAIEATEESILNALCMSDSMEGVNGHFVPGIPLDELCKIVTKYQDLKRELGST